MLVAISIKTEAKKHTTEDHMQTLRTTHLLNESCCERQIAFFAVASPLSEANSYILVKPEQITS